MPRRLSIPILAVRGHRVLSLPAALPIITRSLVTVVHGVVQGSGVRLTGSREIAVIDCLIQLSCRQVRDTFHGCWLDPTIALLGGWLTRRDS